jgi:hypothetical protein
MAGFKIPLDFSYGNFYENNCPTRDENNEKNVEESIADFIMLLVNSPNGSFKPDFSFGFSLKNYRFENTDSEDKINQRKIEGKSDNVNNYAIDLKEAIKRFETRLQSPEVKIEFDKKQSEVSVFISGTLINTRKEYNQELKFHIWK